MLGRKEEVAEVGEAAGNPALPWDHLKVLIRAACILDCHSPSASAPLLDQGRKLRASWEPAAFWSSQGAFPPPLKAGAQGPGLWGNPRTARYWLSGSWTLRGVVRKCHLVLGACPWRKSNRWAGQQEILPEACYSALLWWPGLRSAGAGQAQGPALGERIG